MDDQWTNIDLYHKVNQRTFTNLPVLEGKSAVYSALNFHDLLSQSEKTCHLSAETAAAHPSIYPEKQDWRTFDYRAFYANKDFSVPEYSGYFPNDVYNDFKSSGEYETLSTALYTDVALHPPDFAKLTPEAQQGYRYIEFTEPYSYHDIMRQIQQNVSQCLRPYPDFTGAIRIVVHLG